MVEGEFSQYPPMVDDEDWNALLRHGLVKAGDYIIIEKAGEYLAVNGKTGKCDYGSEDDFGGATGTDKLAVQQAAIDALEAGNGGVIVLINNTLHASCTYEDDILIFEYYQGQFTVYSNLGLCMPFPILSTDPSTTGWGSAEEGRWWYNTTSHEFKYWDASAKRTIQTQVGVGYIEGTETITAGNTEVTVTHNKGETNHPQVTPITDLGGRGWWVPEGSIGINSFKIEIDSADPFTDFKFKYRV